MTDKLNSRPSRVIKVKNSHSLDTCFAHQLTKCFAKQRIQLLHFTFRDNVLPRVEDLLNQRPYTCNVNRLKLCPLSTLLRKYRPSPFSNESRARNLQLTIPLLFANQLHCNKLCQHLLADQIQGQLDETFDRNIITSRAPFVSVQLSFLRCRCRHVTAYVSIGGVDSSFEVPRTCQTRAVTREQFFPFHGIPVAFCKGDSLVRVAGKPRAAIHLPIFGVHGCRDMSRIAPRRRDGFRQTARTKRGRHLGRGLRARNKVHEMGRQRFHRKMIFVGEQRRRLRTFLIRALCRKRCYTLKSIIRCVLKT